MSTRQISMLVFLLSSLCYLSSQAITSLQFYPVSQQGFIFARGADSLGNQDDDPVRMFQWMNVPAQGSFAGQGKVIKSSNKDFQLICSQGQNMCEIMLSAKSSRVQLVPGAGSNGQGSMKYLAVGDEADTLIRQFQMSADRVTEFQSRDQRLSIRGTPGYFEVLAQ